MNSLISKKIGALLLSAVTLSSIFGGCSQVDTDSKVENINLTYVKSPLNVPSIIERNKGFLQEAVKEDEILINYHEITSGPEQTQALAAGELDFLHALGGTSALIAASQGVEMKILNVYSRGGRGFMLLTQDETIKSSADLMGKKVGGPKGTVLHQLLITALKSVGLTQDDVEFVSMGLPDAQAALANGSIDVALLAGPVALKTINEGAKIVTTGEGLVDGTLVTAVSKTFYENNKELVDRFYKVEKQTLQYMEEHVEEVLQITSKEVGLTTEQTKEMYSWYDFDLNISQKDKEELEKTQQFLIEAGLQEKEVDIESLFIYE